MVSPFEKRKRIVELDPTTCQHSVVEKKVGSHFAPRPPRQPRQPRQPRPFKQEIAQVVTAQSVKSLYVSMFEFGAAAAAAAAPLKPGAVAAAARD